ncbi:MAG TPA: hypothetical protein VKU00_24420 [Chthonomonadaceae bacterium]|nr:hypothetical protein [Chthonomonadaceae bacterium]
MALENAGLTKIVRAQIARRSIDTSLLSINVIGGVVHLIGVLRPVRGNPNIDLTEEMNHISTILRQKGAREVVWDVSLRV